MFLIERIFGFGTYMLILILMCAVLTKTNAPAKPTLKIYILLLCVMAFFYKPYVTGDLYRIYEQMEFFSKMDIVQFWENYVTVSSTPAARLLYWLVSKTGVFELLPAISAFICYSCIFYVITETQKMFSVSKKNVAYVLFFVMTSSIYISVVGGVRMMLSLSLLTFSFFRLKVLKRVNIFDLLFCAVAVFMHSMGLVTLVIFLIVMMFEPGQSVPHRLLFITTVLAIGVAFLFNFGGIVSDIFDKAMDYILGDYHFDLWEYVMGVLILALLAILLFEYCRFRKDPLCPKLRPVNASVIVSMLVALAFCFEFSMFYRFGAHLAVILAIPTMLVTLEKSEGKPCRLFGFTDFKSVLLVISVVIAVISCSRGSLSSLKFFEL